MPPRTETPEQRALRLIGTLGGTVRTTEATRRGIPTRVLYRLRDAGKVEQHSRGVYRLASLSPASAPDLMVVAARFPKAVLCLISALAFHELTEEVPHEVHIALPRGAEQPRLDHPPLQVVRMSPTCLRAGVETHTIDGLALRVYSPAKTVADCFKFRNRVGLETALAALKALRRRRGFDVEQLLRFARVCRVEKVMRPYVEAIL